MGNANVARGEIEHIHKKVGDTPWGQWTKGDNWAVITVGGNDIENTEAVWEAQGKRVREGGHLQGVIDQKLKLWRELLTEVKRRVGRVVVWLPGIGAEGDMVWWRSWVLKMEKIAIEVGVKCRWTMNQTEEGSRSYWRKWGGGRAGVT